MPTTPILALPYPAPTDPADVPSDIQKLDQRIEATLNQPNGLAQLDASGKLPSGSLPTVSMFQQLGRVDVTANIVMTNQTLEASPVTVAALPVIAFDGVMVCEIRFSAPAVIGVQSNNHFAFNLWAMDTPQDLGRLLGPANAGGAGGTIGLGGAANLRRRFVPPSGSRSYAVRVWTLQGTSGSSFTIYAGTGGAGAYLPATLTIDRVA
jgi:hypothetical protein